MSAFPDVRVLEVERDPIDLVEMLRDQELDLFMCGRVSLPDIPDLHFEIIRRGEYGYFVREGHPLLEHAPVPQEAFADYKLVIPAVIQPTHPMYPRWLKLIEGQITRPYLVCDNYATLCEIVLSSDAILGAPGLDLSHLLGGRKLMRLKIDGPPAPYDTMVVHMKDRRLSPPARKFVELLSEIIGNLK